MIVLALTSVRGRSGKDTLIEQLVARGRKVARVAFGDVLKEQCARDLASWKFSEQALLDAFHSDAKDHLKSDLAIRNLPEGTYKNWLMFTADRYGDARWMEASRTPRWHLQQYGTQYRRNFMGEPDVWLNEGLKAIYEHAQQGADLVVVTDLRQRNEYKALMNLEGTLWAGIVSTVKVEKVAAIRLHRMWFVPGVDDASYHVTDLDLIGHKMDAVVLNEWGYPSLMVDQLIAQEVIEK